MPLEYLDDSDDDTRDDEESGGMRRTCSLSDLNALPNTSSSSSGPVPRRKRSFHRHRNGFILVLLHYFILRSPHQTNVNFIFSVNVSLVYVRIHVLHVKFWFIKITNHVLYLFCVVRLCRS